VLLLVVELEVDNTPFVLELFVALFKVVPLPKPTILRRLFVKVLLPLEAPPVLAEDEPVLVVPRAPEPPVDDPRKP